MDAHGINEFQSKLENYPSDIDLEWVVLLDPTTQLKQWRASVQGSHWLWDRYHDPVEYLLIGETYMEKIYWPVAMDIIFFP